MIFINGKDWNCERQNMIFSGVKIYAQLYSRLTPEGRSLIN